MGVHIHGQKDLAVAEQFLYHLWMEARGWQLKCGKVAQIMKVDTSNAVLAS